MIVIVFILILLAVDIWAIVQYATNPQTQETMGVMHDVSCSTQLTNSGRTFSLRETCTGTVSYEVNKVSFQIAFNEISSFFSPTYQNGASVTVLYDPANPQHATITPRWHLLFVIAFVTLMMVALIAVKLRQR